MRRVMDPFELRVVSASDVLDQSVDFEEYPHRYLLVHSDTGLTVGRQAMPRLLAAVEMLEDQSWELVNILAKEVFYAVMRRPDQSED